MPRLAGWLGLAGVVIAADQATKVWVMAEFMLGESVEVTSFFNLVFVYNTGAAFSFLAGGVFGLSCGRLALAGVQCRRLGHHRRRRPDALASIHREGTRP